MNWPCISGVDPSNDADRTSWQLPISEGRRFPALHLWATAAQTSGLATRCDSNPFRPSYDAPLLPCFNEYYLHRIITLLHTGQAARRISFAVCTMLRALSPRRTKNRQKLPFIAAIFTCVFIFFWLRSDSREPGKKSRHDGAYYEHIYPLTWKHIYQNRGEGGGLSCLLFLVRFANRVQSGTSLRSGSRNLDDKMAPRRSSKQHSSRTNSHEISRA